MSSRLTQLDGINVLEVGPGIGAAFCGKLLRQLGANVVKAVGSRTEPSGRAAIRVHAERAYLDDGKDHLVATLESPEFADARARADIVVRGLDPVERGGAAGARLRDEYERWRVAAPSLVYVALTPFGASGALAGWSGGDLHAQALSGWVSVNGYPDEPPLSVGYGIGAMQQGLSAAGAALAALVARGRSGRGEFVDVSEAHVLAASIRNYALVYRWNRIPMVRSGMRAPGSSGRYPHSTFPCKDGMVLLIVRSDIEWKRFLGMIGDPPWAEEPRYQDMYAMATEYPDEVDALIGPWIAARTKEELSALATEHGVALAPVRTVDEVLADPQFHHREFFDEVDDEGRRLTLPGLPAIIRRA